MADIHTRIDGQIGRITLTRPKALNALSYEMCLEIEKALDAYDAAGYSVPKKYLRAQGKEGLPPVSTWAAN
ncbi:MAG: enoyl-CoA hydratase/isomerase family protein, partial [Pseudomonadota bacterium]|nr:enoyl-CoA hydratase/isomerase family protein [Pseudomonadota bacterium]